MNKIFFILFFLIICKSVIYGQEYETVIPKSFFNGQVLQGTIIDGDTVPIVKLQEVIIRPPFVFKSQRQREKYSRLVLYVKKVYPYSQLIKVYLNEIEYALDTIPGAKAQKDFLKLKEKELRDEFEDELTHLTITQGRILMKLVDRETGQTTYEVVKELKGNFTAFFYQSIARLFGSNMKDDYEPNGDDAMIEDIVIRIENGTL